MPKSSTLFIANLPERLKDSDKEDLLKYYGAKSVRCMPSGCRYRGTAFAIFGDVGEAEKALKQLHQLEVLGSLLRAEYCRDYHGQYLPSELEEQPAYQLAKFARSNDKVAPQSAEPVTSAVSHQLSDICGAWDVKYPANPTLFYNYPRPTVTILTNIANALASVPKFYTQTLHLMNKMHLPAPFGALSPTPRLVDDRRVHADEMEEREMDISTSSEESELEEAANAVPMKNNSRPPPPVVQSLRRQQHKPRKAKLSVRKEKRQSLWNAAAPKQVDLASIFENAVLQEQKKIEIKVGLSSQALKPQACVEGEAAASTEAETVAKTSAAPDSLAGGASTALTSAVPPKDLLSILDNEAANFCSVSTGGLQLTMPQPRLPPVGLGNGSPQEQYRDAASASHPPSEAAPVTDHKQLSPAEMTELPVFRNYTPGEPSSGVYIKNLAKQVTREDLARLYNGVLKIPSDAFDVRLMMEGRMKGQAFVSFSDTALAAKALKDTNGLILHGKPMVVAFSRSSKDK